jgi:hypothetical protein
MVAAIIGNHHSPPPVVHRHAASPAPVIVVHIPSAPTRWTRRTPSRVRRRTPANWRTRLHRRPCWQLRSSLYLTRPRSLPGSLRPRWLLRPARTLCRPLRTPGILRPLRLRWILRPVLPLLRRRLLRLVWLALWRSLRDSRSTSQRCAQKRNGGSLAKHSTPVCKQSPVGWIPYSRATLSAELRYSLIRRSTS